MKIVSLVADNFKRLVAVEIRPDGSLVEVTGKNGSGKSSVLDAIYVALKGRSAAPPRPIREGEEECHIKLDLGELIVTRKFTKKEGGTYTDTLKVETAEGLRYGQPQQTLDALLGEIGFDPFEFCQMKPDKQAATLLEMVPLPVDLDELRELDESDYLKRRDVNRDMANAKTMLASIPKADVPETLPDRPALQEQLANAAETNSAIERDRMGRQLRERNIQSMRESGEAKIVRAEQLRAEADALEKDAGEILADADTAAKELAAMPALAEPVDTAALRQQLTEAEAILTAAAQQRVRASHAERVAALEAESEKLTKAMADREEQRRKALAEAKMPVEGLGFLIDEKGKPCVTFNGVPFEQASTAEQLRASTAIAMAANPQLRVLQIKDGSLLDEDSLKLLGEMVSDQDFQLWIEKVGTGGVGFVMENGLVKAAPASDTPPNDDPPEEVRKQKAAAKRDAAKPEGTLV